MPASIVLKSIAYTAPDGRSLFNHLDLSFGPRRTGIVGRNGTGKTTLLQLVAGELTPSSGNVTTEGRIAVLRQAVQVDDRTTIADAFGAADGLARLARIIAGNGQPGDFDLADWTLEERLAVALADTGLAGFAPDRLLATLSGGERTRVALAALRFDAPDAILLDEPTNNLDAGGRAAVAALLRDWRGTALVVSHDRELLDEMDAIVELTSLGVETYGGNYTAYAARKALELAAAEQRLGSADRKLGEVDRKLQAQREKQARRDGAGSRKAARGDLPRILLGGMKENAEGSVGAQSHLASKLRGAAETDLREARAEVEILQPISVRLASTHLPAGKTVLQFYGVGGGVARPLLRDLSLAVTGPERVAITGPNGAGKTTLLRLATGELAPSAGSVRITPSYALLDQTLGALDPGQSIVENFRRLNPADDENASRAALARLMFRADASAQLVGTLSGGEMLRAGLACALGGSAPPELLILDEPTNHLDLDAIAAVEAGLLAYDGAVLVVSHDRRFLDAIGITRTIRLAGDGSAMS